MTISAGGDLTGNQKLARMRSYSGRKEEIS